MNTTKSHHRTLWARWMKGSHWSWISRAHADQLPADFDQSVMSLESTDRLHAKQGRSTARIRLDGPGGSVTGYLKRHRRLPLSHRVAALIFPGGRFSPGAAEWSNLERAAQIGVPVPAPLAAGEIIGPGLHLESYLLVRELTDCLELHVALPRWKHAVAANDFQRLKRRLVRTMAEITARLHREHLFHKDLYLCHFFTPAEPSLTSEPDLTLIDLHRLQQHRWLAARWRLKDLAQLLYSTDGVDGVDDRDRLRFWMHYRRALGLGAALAWRKAIQAKAARYRRHNNP